MSEAAMPALRHARSTEGPRLGLALSGGGFRAAFFHVGVLAQLAERALLRPIQVISTVSGGSIVGALYYLHVMRLLERIPDARVTDEHYLTIVERIAKSLPRAVDRNVRARAFLNPAANLRMARSDYSRTDRIGELYERCFYRAVLETDEPIPMRSLLIEPAGRSGGDPFDADTDNAGRRAPVPMLLLNATTLNTGHNWRFEAKYVGEPDLYGPAGDEVDKNARLARTRYDDLGEPLRSVTLGAAVAASGCFPGLCKPLEFPIRYALPGDGEATLDVRLMDGGAHDNQGIEGLLDRGCTHLIVSDASGQLADADSPPPRIPAVIERANGIMFDRVRDLQLMDALSRLSIAYMHLQKGLPAPVLEPLRAGGEPAAIPGVKPPPQLMTTDFGVARDVQRLLARIRTDLDAFSEVETKSLVLDGYRMTGATLEHAPEITALAGRPPGSPQWAFASVAGWMAEPTDAYRLLLRAGAQRLFKPLVVSPLLRGLALTLLLTAASGLSYLAYRLYDRQPAHLAFGVLIAVLAAGVLALLYLKPALPVIGRASAPLYDSVLPLVLALVLPLVALWLLFWSRVYLRLGAEGKLGL